MKKRIIISCLLLAMVFMGQAQNDKSQEISQCWKEYDAAMKTNRYETALKICGKIDSLNKVGDRWYGYKEKDTMFFYRRALAYGAQREYVYAVCDLTSAIELDTAGRNKGYYIKRGEYKKAFGDASYKSDLVKGGVAKMSDIDNDIPQAAETDRGTYVVIIANEEYEDNDIATVQYAKRDGETFYKYCNQTLGIPEENIKMKQEATLANIKQLVRWLQEKTSNYPGEARAIFYYAGHGMPDANTGKGYILPVDCLAENDIENWYSISNLYERLSNLKVSRVMVFMDACFSGKQRDGGMLTMTRGVGLSYSGEGMLSGKMVVFSAAQGTEAAFPYEKEGHGLFTYYLLKKLKESKGNVTLGELSEYVTRNVRNVKSQTPNVIHSNVLDTTWKTMKIR